MNEGLFNSTFEMGLRILLLTNSKPTTAFTWDRLLALDFISCYAETFGLAAENLHGNNTYMYGEIAGRRWLVKEALKRLVLEGKIQVLVENGYKFKITKSGRKIADLFRSPYAVDYQNACKLAIKKYARRKDESILREIQQSPLIRLKE